MNEQQKIEVLALIKQFQADSLKFLNKEIPMPVYKKMSGGFGSYAQRGGEKCMIRNRIPGGVLSSADFLYLNDLIQSEPIGYAHITTNQNLQLHDCDFHAIESIMSKGIEYGIHGFGSGGNFPRNVTMSPLSGLLTNDYFDVYPYVQATTKHLFTYLPKPNLPRKLKCAFSANDLDEIHVTMRELGFLARPNLSFDVYICGGLGRNAGCGIKVIENLDPNDCVKVYAAFVEFYRTYGDYENAQQARSRYILAKYGEEDTKAKFLAIYDNYKDRADLKLGIVPTKHALITSEILENHGLRLTNDTYAYLYAPKNGNLDPVLFNTIATYLNSNQHIEVRFTPSQKMYFVNLTSTNLTELQTLLPNPNQTLLESSLACVGKRVCQIGIQESPVLLSKILEVFEYIEHPYLPQVQISGCLNSCGAHQSALIGFSGTAKVIDRVPHVAYEVFVFGQSNPKHPRVGQSVGVMLEQDIPGFLVALNKVLDEDFITWYPKHVDEFNTLAQQYIG